MKIILLWLILAAAGLLIWLSFHHSRRLDVAPDIQHEIDHARHR